MASVYKSLSKSSGKSKDATASDGPKNRQRVLILSSRGVTQRHRHLLNDLYSLLPHSRKDAKFDTKSKLYQLNELADMYNCNNVFFFEARKGKDLYLWMSKPPNGPTVKMHLQNLHTMEELHFTGNCLKGSRPILSFDSTFDTAPHLQVMKELFTHVFGVPQGARKSKPFVDHVMSFTVADGKVWIRCYQINETEAGKANAIPEANGKMGDGEEKKEVEDKTRPRKNAEKGETKLSLIEIGPRFVLTPIVIQEGSFGGPIIYENKEFVSPNQIRRDLRLAKASTFGRRSEAGVERTVRRGELGLNTRGGVKRPRNALDERELFA
ncbi:hypothetical protein MBLNU457_5185t1 [Dothideomycetes sp. NU457]